MLDIHIEPLAPVDTAPRSGPGHGPAAYVGDGVRTAAYAGQTRDASGSRLPMPFGPFGPKRSVTRVLGWRMAASPGGLRIAARARDRRIRVHHRHQSERGWTRTEHPALER